MIRYWLSVLILAAGLVFIGSVTRCGFLALIDLPSFIITIMTPFLFVTILFGFKDTCRAFSVLYKKEKKQDTLLSALGFFKVYSKAIWISAIIAVLTGGTGMLINLDVPSAIGPHLALALVALLYGGVAQLAIVLPYTVLINKHLGNSNIHSDLFSLFGSLFGVTAVYFLLFVILVPV